MRLGLALLLTLCSSVVSADDTLFRSLQVTTVTTAGLDLHSSFYALHHGHREMNPVVRELGPTGWVVTKSAVTAGHLLLIRRLHRTKPTLATWCLVGLTVGQAVIAGRNYRIGAQR